MNGSTHNGVNVFETGIALCGRFETSQATTSSLPTAATVECWEGHRARDVVTALCLLVRTSPSVSLRPDLYEVVWTYITRHVIQSDSNNI